MKKVIKSDYVTLFQCTYINNITCITFISKLLLILDF